MTKRLAEQYDRDPNGWYVETRASVAQLADAIDFSIDGVPDLIWDPSCGGGTIPSVMFERGHPVIGSDIIDRPKWDGRPFSGGRGFYRSNFLKATKWPTARDGRALSIFCNPPYNEPIKGIAEEFVHRVLEMVPFHRAAFIVPIEFLAGQGRYERLYSRRPPSHVAIYSERPSMPPGEELLRHGESIRGGGMADYCAVVWTAGGPYRTETLFLRPSTIDEPLPQSLRRKRNGSPRSSASTLTTKE